MRRHAALAALAATAIFASLGGCAAADPTGGLLGEPTGEVVAEQKARQQKSPAGETMVCETRSPNRVSDGRYGFRGDRMQRRCDCFPDRYVDAIIDSANAGLGDDQ